MGNKGMGKLETSEIWKIRKFAKIRKLGNQKISKNFEKLEIRKLENSRKLENQKISKIRKLEIRKLENSENQKLGNQEIPKI